MKRSPLNRKTSLRSTGFLQKKRKRSLSPSLLKKGVGKSLSSPSLPEPRKKPLRKCRLGPGKRTKEWATLRPLIVKELERLGITSCELRLPGCQGSYNLSLSHAVKRRFIEKTAVPGSPKHIQTVARACAHCHWIADYRMSHSNMEVLIMLTIAAREYPVSLVQP